MMRCVMMIIDFFSSTTTTTHTSQQQDSILHYRYLIVCLLSFVVAKLVVLGVEQKGVCDRR
jgi:hypothetical protein